MKDKYFWCKLVDGLFLGTVRKIKFLPLLLMLVLPFAGQAEQFGDFLYTARDDNTVMITKYVGSAAEGIVPSVINGKNVTEIQYNAFYYCTSLTNIIIPSCVTNIAGADIAFVGCTSLTSIAVDGANSVYSSADGLLFNKNVTSFIKCPPGRAGTIIISDRITSINKGAFYSCSKLTGVIIPNSITNIGSSAFTSCSKLTSITIPSSVVSIGSLAFFGCSSLVEITAGENNPIYSSLNGILYNKARTTLILYPPGKVGSFTIPDHVTLIGESSFYTCTQLTDVVVPRSVTYIGYLAFSYCNRLANLFFQGDAPGLSSSAFLGSSAKVYYLPETTGWDSTYGERPTMMATATPALALSCSPPGGGATSGGGVKTYGTLATVTAAANSGFRFVNWTENGTEVSSSKSYVFMAAINRTLVANFSELVFEIPWQGTSTLSYSPSGTLCQILSDKSIGLLYREREVGGSFSETPVGFYGTQPMLLFDPQGQPNIVDGSGGDYSSRIDWYRKSGGTWEKAGDVVPPDSINLLDGMSVNYGDYLPELLSAPRYLLWSAVAAAFAPDGSLRILVCGKPAGQEPYDTRLYLGSNAGDGVWRWTVIETFQWESFETATSYIPPRYFNFSVDRQGVNHILYTAGFYYSEANYPNNQYRSELRYVSDITGVWKREVVSAPLDSSAEAAWGGSLAVDSDGNVAVASFYVERASTGSPEYANLLYHQRQANGTWTREAIVTSPDGYSAGDGPKFTGAYPDLVFDSQNHPHIVFCDYATQHWPLWHCCFYAGQIRYAYHDGTRWTFKTLYRQTDPLHNEMRFPIVAVRDGELSFAGMKRMTEIDTTGAILSMQDEYVEGHLALPVSLTIIGGTGSGLYTNGQQVVISANPPASGKVFFWTGATQYVASATSLTTTVTMPAQAITLTATYKDPPHVNITVSAGGGSVSPSGDVLANIGGSLTLTAVSDPGYKIKHWLVNGSVSNAGQATLTLTNITADTTVSVVFEKFKAMPWLNLLLE